jgi:hypothetical protein
MANLDECEGKDLTINDILGITDSGVERLFIPEWGGSVYIKVMTAKERSEIEDLFLKINETKKETGKFRREMIRRTWSDKDGNLVITDEALATHMMGKSALAIEKIFERACEVNGFRQRDVEALKKK